MSLFFHKDILLYNVSNCIIYEEGEKYGKNTDSRR